MPVLAIDLGGSKLLAALVEGDAVLEALGAATPRGPSPQAWLDAIVALCAGWRGRYGHAALAVTGLVVRGCWWALNPAVLPVPAGFALTESLSSRLGVPILAVNDAQAAAWGEYRFGAGCGLDMVFATISTGVGGGIVLGGRLLKGRGGLAGHIGQMRLDVDGEMVRFEDVASGSALARAARRLSRDVEAPELFAAASQGEAWARG